MTLTRRAFLAGASACMVAPWLGAGAAETAPSGELIFGYGKTGIGSALAVDTAASLAQSYQQNHYQLVNIPSGNSLRAVSTVKRAAPDGRTLLQAQSPQMNLLPVIYRSLPYDPLTDFEPLAIMGEYTLFLTVGKLVDPRVKTLDDYLRWVERNPEYRNVGFTQFGSTGHIAQAILARQKEVALQPVAYFGSSMMIEDLLNGYLSAGLVISGNASGAFRSGRLRAVAVTSTERHPGWENIPTCMEQGVPEMSISGWYGWFAPAAMPDRIYTPLAEALQQRIQHEHYTSVLERYSLKPVSSSSPDKIRERIRDEQEYYRELVDSYHISRI
ncbi:Bug family tripartite tricarboxylate transporter substrate binding protein [Dickeya dadantii]|uniref:Bug family tripartite tricarboxylate transporter substrate binding protein n=1 Tax=Dickeya dadantii TaxID=204038 RepID=UPI0021D933C5|nr:tripartite tricarboxylate transporter substrate binding protein [Dickeya dadantii]